MGHRPDPKQGGEDGSFGSGFHELSFPEDCGQRLPHPRV